MSFVLSPEREAELQTLLSRYPNKQAACIPVLHLAQNQHGWVSGEVISWVAETLGLSTAHVLGVATFYSLLHTEPVGEHQIWVCRTLSCALNGSDSLLAHCERRLGIKCGQSTADGKITLRTAECLASCGSGPVMQIDDRYYEHLTAEKVDDLLDQLRANSS